MNKIILIIKREYATRVRKRSFLLTTFLVPIFFIALYVGIIYLTKKSFDDTHGIVYIVDQEGSVGNKLESNKNVTFIPENKDLQLQLETLKEEGNNTSVLLIPSDFYESKQAEFLSSNKPNISTQREIQNELATVLRNHKLEELGVNVENINEINSDVTITAKEITESGDAKESNTEVAMGIAITLSILIYLSLFLYGSQVMRGIIEEKTSRVIEVIISSVKPFQLMLGKIIGIGLVGLTQFFLWLLLSLLLAGAASTFLVNKDDLQEQIMGSSPQNTSSTIDSTSDIMAQNDVMTLLSSVNISEIVICFFIFFLGGYLLYSALFAAVASAIDSETEASQFTMPITMPLLLTYALSFGVLINDPHGSVATWLSFIPFTSPIAMLVRIPFGVPTWQIITSASLLIIGFIFTTWVAARIYRVGILMYGKKASIKELIKWFNYKS